MPGNFVGQLHQQTFVLAGCVMGYQLDPGSDPALRLTKAVELRSNWEGCWCSAAIMWGVFWVRKNGTNFRSKKHAASQSVCFFMLSSTHQVFVCFWIHGIFFLPVLPPSSASKEISRRKSTFCQSCDVYDLRLLLVPTTKHLPPRKFTCPYMSLEKAPFEKKISSEATIDFQGISDSPDSPLVFCGVSLYQTGAASQKLASLVKGLWFFTWEWRCTIDSIDPFQVVFCLVIQIGSVTVFVHRIWFYIWSNDNRFDLLFWFSLGVGMSQCDLGDNFSTWKTFLEQSSKLATNSKKIVSNDRCPTFPTFQRSS